MNFVTEIVEEVRALSPVGKDLRNLGLVFLGAFGIIGAVVLWQGGPSGPYWIGAGVLFGLWGLIWPAGLKPVLEKAIDNDRPAVIDVTIERGSETSPWKYITG